MTSITAVIIARNEEKMITDCLRSVSFCDEIIVIDNNSHDRTREIAQKFGAKVYEYATNDFSKARNYGLEKARSEWILYIDADERVSKKLTTSIISILKNGSEFVAFTLRRKNFYLGNHEWPSLEHLERFFLKSKLKKWQGKLHESPIVIGEIGELKGDLYHLTHRNLTEMLTKTILWSTVEARLRFDANHPRVVWWRFPRVMLSGFLNSYISQSGYKAGTVGIIESAYQAFSMFVTYAKLWEMQNTKLVGEKKDK